MATSKRKGSPFYQFSFTVHGARFRGSTGKSSKREADAYEAAERVRVQAGAAVPDRWRVRNVLGAYWSERGQHTANHATLWGHLEALRNGLGTDTFAADISAPMLLRFVAKHRMGKRGVRSIATMNRVLEVLRSAMRHATNVHAQAMPAIRWGDLMRKEPAPRVRYLKRAQFDALLGVADDELRAMILLAVTTGLRRENVRALDWSQVDLDARRIVVTVKGGKNAEVRLSPPAVAALARVGGRKGRVFTGANWRKRWEAARAKAGLAGFRWHDLRHTFGAWARMAGADLAAISDAMHHSDLSVTRRYAVITPDDAPTAWDRVGELFAPTPVEKKRTA